MAYRGDLWAIWRVVDPDVAPPSRVAALRRRREELRRQARPDAPVRRWWRG